MVRDPIYDYIRFSKPLVDSDIGWEKAIIDSACFQRLRRIKQLQSAWLVYPSAVHDRFGHSLGVMHLAGKYAQTIFLGDTPFYLRDLSKSIVPKEIQECNTLNREISDEIQIARLAGLVHDLGHGPYSHLFDDCVLRQIKVDGQECSHEIITKKMITSLDDITKPLEKMDINPWDIVDVLNKDVTGLDPFRRAIARMFRGGFSVDNFDYLKRDAFYTGAKEYGTVDVGRIMFSTAFDIDHGLALERRALGAYQRYLYARSLMFEWVYYHRTARAAELMLKEVLDIAKNEFRINDRIDNLESYLDLTEDFLHQLILNWRNKRGNKRKAYEIYRDLIVRRNIYFREINVIRIPLNKTEILRIRRGITNLEEVQNRIINRIEREGIDREHIKVDWAPHTTYPMNPVIISEKTEKEVVTRIFDSSDPESSFIFTDMDMLRKMPWSIALARVFGDRSLKKDQQQKIRKISREEFKSFSPDVESDLEEGIFGASELYFHKEAL